MSNSPLTPRNKVFIILFGVIAAAVLIIAAISLATPPAPAVDLVNYGPLNDFNMVDQDNNSVTLDSYNADVLILTFMYTHCGDLPNSTTPGCNAETAKLNTAMGSLKDQNYNSSQFHILSVSFDYLFDNVSSMKAYGQDRAESQFDYWSFLSGNKTEVLDMTTAYGFCSFYFNDSLPSTVEQTCEQYTYTASTTTTNSTATAADQQNNAQAIAKIDHGGENSTDGWIHGFLVFVADKNRDIRKLYTDPYWKASDLVNVVKAILAGK